MVRFDHSLSSKKLTTVDILRDKAGTRRDFVTIFTEMCEVGGIKFKTITGFIKDDNYHPGITMAVSSPNILIHQVNGLTRENPPWKVGLRCSWKMTGDLLIHCWEQVN